MGRMLGAFDNDDELDRPDLNKCPDCLCFFADDVCPICGKVCPEEMRAGNRKAVKPKRVKSGGTQYRVTFIPWYQRWWFILLMMFLSPFSIVGIVLLITSPYKKWVKILFAVLIGLYLLISTFGFTLFHIFSDLWSEPVDRSLSETEYVAACKTVTAEDVFRAPEAHKEEFVAITLTVRENVVDSEAYSMNLEFPSYYVCTDATGEFEILIRDCVIDGQNYVFGDMILVYGEGAGTVSFYDIDWILRDGSCINAAFISLVG